MTFEYRGRSVDIRGTDLPSTSDVIYDIAVDGKQYAISYGHLPGRAIARAKRLIDAEFDKKFAQMTVGLKGSEMDIRRRTKEDLDAINECPRAWKAQQAMQTGCQPDSPKAPNSSSCQ